MNLNVEEILSCTKGNLIFGDLKKECKNFSRDTRTLSQGDTYICIKGENFDGNIFWEEAFKNGADVVIANKINIDEETKEKYLNQDKTLIEVEDTVKALGEMATMKRNKYGNNLKVIAVTGSVGKTSTKDIIYSVISQKYKALKTQGNKNNNIGLPLTILSLQDEKICVIEMNRFGEISYLSKIARPDIVVITNIGTSHIGNLGSRENILKAKLEVLDGMEKPNLVINNDNNSETLLKARVNEEQKQEIRDLAIKAFKAIDGSGLSRVDFFVEDKTGKVYINEINTMPGFTEISMYPKLFEAYGFKYSELLDKIIEVEMK